MKPIVASTQRPHRPRYNLSLSFCLLVLTVGIVWGGLELQAAQAAELRVGLQSLEGASAGMDAHHTTNAHAQVLYSIHETLITREPQALPLQFKPALAASWKMIQPTIMEVALRKGVKFHDGSVVTADDVAFSLNRIWQRSRPEYEIVQGQFFYNFDRVEVADPYTVRIHTKRPEPLIEVLLSDLCAGIVSKGNYDRLGFEKADLSPVGAGPYRVVTYKPGHLLVVERFDDYWGEKAPLDKITFTVIPEISSRITALANREVDFIVSIPPDQVGPLANRKDVKLLGIVWPMFHVYAINMTHPITGDQKLRQAMNLSVDREALVKGLWGGKAIVPRAHQFKEYGEPLYMPELSTVRYDPEKARQLLKESGYKGDPILLTFMPHYYTYGSLAAQAIAEMWQKVGINVKLQIVDSFPSDLKNIMIRPWSNPMYYPDPMGAYDTHWSNSAWPYRRSFFRPNHPQWNELYEKARFATDATVRRDAYAELVRIAEDESGYILLYQPYEAFAMRSDIEWTPPKTLRPYTLTFRAGQIAVGK